MDEWRGHRVMGDIEVMKGTLGLSSVIAVGRDVHRAH
jgi:hypothetical protein